MKERCNYCSGDGWTIESAHDAYCDGTCTNCPVAEQVQCEYCEGRGFTIVEDFPEPIEFTKFPPAFNVDEYRKGQDGK